MSNIASLRQDKETTRSLGDIIDVLKTAALTQFSIFQSRKDGPQQEFSRITDDCLDILLSRGIKHPFLFDRESLITAVVVITSDEGFLGDLNTLLINAAVDLLKSREDEIIILGERGIRYLQDMGVKHIGFSGITDDVGFKETEPVRNHILTGYKRRLGRVYVVYPKFISLAVQRVENFLLLPYQRKTETPNAQSILISEMLIEPSERNAIENLVNLWLGFKMFEIFWASKHSEYAARILHLEGSTQELSHLNQKLSFDYFKEVHALKDKSIREISASKIILGGRNG